MNIGTIGIYAYITYDLKVIGGLEAQVFHLANELIKRNYNVVIHCLASPSDEAKDEVVGYGLTTCSSPYFTENFAFSKRFKEDIIFAFGIRNGKIFDMASQVAKNLDVKLVSFVYFTKEESIWRSKFNTNGIETTNQYQEKFMDNYKNVCKTIVEESDLVIVPTEYVRGELVAHANYKDLYKIKVCYHGIHVDNDILPSRDKWKKLNPTFVHASRLKHPESIDKGIYWTDKFADSVSGSKVYVCGNGNYQFRSENVKNMGLLNQHELHKLMKEKCLYSLIPSQMEAGCTIALESIMCECIPIALNMAGLAEVMKMIGMEDYLVEPVKHHIGDIVSRDWFIYEPDDVTHIFKYPMKKIFADLKNAQKIIQEKFTIEKTTDKLLQYIERGLDDKFNSIP